jgi:transcriptional regulator of met regulon
MRDLIADVLARAYDGQPLADMRGEHAAHHLEAADAVMQCLRTDPQK